MQTVNIHFQDVKDAFLKIVRDKQPIPAAWQGTRHAERLATARRTPDHHESFAGGKPSETLVYITEGYKRPEFANAGEYVKAAPRRRRRWSETDGTVDVSRMLAGEPRMFGKRVKQDIKPGLRIIIDYAFHCGIQAETIADYGAWIASFVGALETNGYDLEIDIRSKTRGQWRGKGRETVEIYSRVKDLGEISNFNAWSCLFAPTGFRHLIFTSYFVAADKAGERCESGLGAPTSGSEWKVEYDRAENLITIGCNSGGHVCNIDKLTSDAQAAGLL